MASSLRRLVLLLAAVFALSSSVAAQPYPIAISPTTAVPGGLNTMVTYDARGVAGAANAGYYTRPVLVSNNTLTGLVKGAARRTAPALALTAAIAAAGWAIDELTKQVMIPANGVPLTPGQSVACTWDPNIMCRAVASDWVGYVPTWTGGTYVVTSVQVNPPALLVNGGEAGSLPLAYDTFSPGDHIDASAGLSPKPVPNADLATFARNNPALWDSLLHNADGSVNRNPDVMADAAALRSAITANNANHSGQSQWDQGTQAGPSEGQGATSSEPFELPAFCSWASVICEFIDWVKGEDEGFQDAELPITEVPVTPSTWTSGLGSGSCPSDKSLALSRGSFSMSYAPVCQLAGFVRPLVILSALLIGAFIIAGAGRQNV